MSSIEILQRLLFLLLLLFLTEITMLTLDPSEDSQRMETIIREENTRARFTCDLTDVAWWKRPNLLATRYGMILPKYRTQMSIEKLDDGTRTSGIQLHVLNIDRLQSNDSGIYECETLGAIRQFNLTVTVRLTTLELGAQLLSSSETTFIQTSNQTDSHLRHQSSTHLFFNSISPSNHEHLRLRENQLIRLTCVVSRALPAATLHFPFDIDYRVERNSTTQNDDRTFRTILVLILRITRVFHRRAFFCEAIQQDPINDEKKQQQQQQQQHRIRSNSLQMDVVFGPICSQKISHPPTFYTGLRRSINLTCFMHEANPVKLNFTWLLPNGNQRLGYYLNQTASYLTVTPLDSEDFGQAICRAENELGLAGECQISMIMGAVPDEIKSCHHTYQNSTLQVNCVPGFHQGDADFFCYMYKKQDDGRYSEHARLKGNCAFILPDLKPERYHEFRVFTKNKFGDNYDKSVVIAVGERQDSLVEKTRNYWPYMALCIIGACLLLLLIICCCYHHLRRSMYKRKSKGNFDSLTYQNQISHSHTNSNGKHSLVHLKQNGNGTAYPVRPYRSKDYLISSESSNPQRTNAPSRSIYSTEEELISTRRNTLKETDLDQLLGSPSNVGSSATATIKSLPLNRNRPIFAAFGPQVPPLDDLNTHPPLTVQRRSSFQAATKLNGLDFYTTQEPFYLLDRQMMKINQRNHYSPERDLREREQYREKRREYSPDPRNETLIDLNRQVLLDNSRSRENSLIVENRMLTTTTNVEHLSAASSTNEQQWREMNAIDEIDYTDRYIDSNDNDRDDFKDRNDELNDYGGNHDDDDRDRRSPDRVSIDYQRNDDTTFSNYDRDRDDDRYRDDGIFV